MTWFVLSCHWSEMEQGRKSCSVTFESISESVSMLQDLFPPFHLCMEEGITFIPLIAEADGGGWGPQAHKVFHELAKLTSTATGEPEDLVATNNLQSLGLILHRENARAILRRSPLTTATADF